MTERAKRLLIMGVFAILALVAAVGFHETGHQYNDYRQAYGKGVYNIADTELVLYIWYFVFGVAAAAFLTIALLRSEAISSLKTKMEKLFAKRLFLPLATVLLLAEVLLFQSLILQYAPVADDESTYAFIAKTLLSGRLANPPPGDAEFFENQFIRINVNGWYGKYPIGHPLLLALGEAVGTRFLVVPVVACCVFLMTFVVGRRLFSHNQACLALCLLLLSPHFVFVAASQLSQPSASLAMMLGLWALYKIEEKGGALWPLLAGAFFGYGLLVRPFPGSLFVAAAGAAVIFGMKSRPAVYRVKSLAIGAAPILLFFAVLLLVNRAQTGNPLRSGYNASAPVVDPAAPEQGDQATKSDSGPLAEFGFFSGSDGAVAVSIGGAVLRQNFWLFGWPLSLIFVFWGRFNRRMIAFWGMIAADLAYRALLPKTCVSTLGPVYLSEIVPLLALASAGGMARLRKFAAERGTGSNKFSVEAAVVSFFLIAAITFLPVQLREIRRSTTIWRSAYELLGQMTAEKALVFANWMVHPYSDTSWTAFPPPPSPTMDDKVIFVREMWGAGGPERNVEFWKRRFPDRSAWLFRPARDGAVLRKIESSRDFDLDQGGAQ